MASRCLALLLAVASACARPAPSVPTAELRAAIANGPVVAGTEPPDIRFEGFAHGKLEGAGMGAAVMFLGCTAGLRQGSCEGAFCGAGVILWIGVCTVSGAVGSVIGAVVAPSADEVDAAEQQLLAALDGNPMQVPLRDEVVSRASAAGLELTSAPQQRADARLELALTRVGTEGAGIDPPLLLYMEARARILRESDRAELFSADYRYEGQKRTLQEWSAERGAPLVHSLENGYRVLGAEIFESVFRLYPFPDRAVRTSGLLGTAFGLAALSPATRGQLSGDPLIGPWFEWREVEGLRPTLHWQSFPRASDSEAQPAEMSRVRNVRYELVIARERNGAPAERVYRREGLPAARHRLETPLADATRYFWTVRARFELDGRVQLTEWSGTRGTGDVQLAAPSANSFRFRTP